MTGVDGHIPDGIKKSETVNDIDDYKDQHRFAEVEKNIDNTDALGLRLCADGTYDRGGYAVAEVDTDDHGINGLEGQKAGL